VTDQPPFGEWLRRQRRALDLSRQNLANQAGCAEITLRRIEAGTLKPSKELALLLLEKVGIPQNEREQWIGYARGQSGMPSQEQSIFAVQRQTNLPALLTSFIGREKELVDAIKLLEKYRLVTLAGPGGVGKTRLAFKVGEQVLSNYPNGVWLVELAPLTNPELIPQTVASILGINSTANQPVSEVLMSFFRAKTALLMLDNCEHVLEACAKLADALLKHCPNLKVLTTSREAMGILGEATYLVPSLGLPGSEKLLDLDREYESMRLFEERAQLSKFDFSLTLDNASSVAQICRRLDGIPLAIELAAVRVNQFSPVEIAAQLDESFQILTGGSRTALPRQQTLRASINWSWDLLTKPEQQLMRQLSIFSGGWTLGAALNVCDGDVMGLTSSLVRKSLVAMSQEGRRETRYGFHEVIREYSYEKLVEAGEVGTLSQRHAVYFVALAEESEPKLLGPEEIEWLDRLEMESSNLRSVLEWSIRNNTEIGLRLAGALYFFWGVRSYWHEGNAWLERLLALPKEASHPEIRAKALNAAGFLAWCISDAKSSRSLHMEGLAISRGIGNRREEARALHGLGRAARLQSDHQMAHQFYEESLSIWREADDKVGIADTLLSMGALTYRQGNFDEASLLLEESLGLWQELENLSGIAPTFYYLGRVSDAQGNYENATFLYNKTLDLFQRLDDKAGYIYTLESMGRAAHVQADYVTAWEKYQESLNLSREVGHNGFTAGILTDLGHLAMIENNYGEAHTLYAESLMLFKQTGEKQDVIKCLVGWANLAQMIGQTQKATNICAIVEMLLQTNDTKLTPPEREIYEKVVTALRFQLDDQGFAKAWAEGCAMTMEQAIQLALSEINE
jgi:non-specific serine/threonine protein kinase